MGGGLRGVISADVGGCLSVRFFQLKARAEAEDRMRLEFLPAVERAIEYFSAKSPAQRLVFFRIRAGVAVPGLDLCAARLGGRVVLRERHAQDVERLGRAGILGFKQDHVGKGRGEVIPTLLLAKLIAIEQEIDILPLFLAADAELRCRLRSAGKDVERGLEITNLGEVRELAEEGFLVKEPSGAHPFGDAQQRLLEQ